MNTLNVLISNTYQHLHHDCQGTPYGAQARSVLILEFHPAGGFKHHLCHFQLETQSPFFWIDSNTRLRKMCCVKQIQSWPPLSQRRSIRCKSDSLIDCKFLFAQHIIEWSVDCITCLENYLLQICQNSIQSENFIKFSRNETLAWNTMMTTCFTVISFVEPKCRDIRPWVQIRTWFARHFVQHV